MKKSDWEKLKNEYILSKITLRKLAEKHGLTFSAVANHASREHWYDERKQIEDKTKTKVINKLAEQRSRAQFKELSKLVKTADNLNQMIEDISGKTDVFVNEHEKVDTRALLEFTRAAKEIVQITRDIYGLRTVSEQDYKELNDRKLDIEERRTGGNSVDGQGETGVMILPAVSGDEK